MSEVPADLWNEDGSTVWIRRDLCASAGKARYKAYSGDGLPMGFGDGGDGRLIDLEVHVVWARLDPENEHDEWPWKVCAADDAGAALFWEVKVP